MHRRTSGLLTWALFIVSGICWECRPILLRPVGATVCLSAAVYCITSLGSFLQLTLYSQHNPILPLIQHYFHLIIGSRARKMLFLPYLKTGGCYLLMSLISGQLTGIALGGDKEPHSHHWQAVWPWVSYTIMLTLSPLLWKDISSSKLKAHIPWGGGKFL